MPRGARVLVLSQIIKAGAQFVGLAVLSRFILPEEFGAISVAVVIVGIGEILRDMGLSTAAITQPDLTEQQRNLLFFLNTALGVALAALVVIFTPALVAVFDEELLGAALPTLSLVFVLNGLSAQYRAELNRRMRFTALAAADAAAPALGVGVGIALALSGAGFWALVAQQVAISLVAAVFLVGALRWVPRWPRRWRESKELLLFGVHVSWAQALTYLGNQVDVLALGIWSTSAQLGYYNRAYQTTVQPLALLKAPATSVALPLLSRRRDDKTAFARAVARGQRLVAYTIIPGAGLIAGTAAPLVSVVLGLQWAPIATMVVALAIAGAIQQLVSVASWIFLAGNHGRALSRYSTVSLIVKAVLVVVAAPLGPLPVALAFLASVLLMAPLALLWACRTAGVPFASLLSVWRPLTLALLGTVASSLVVALVAAPALAQLALGVIAFAAVYLLGAVFRQVRDDYTEVLRLFGTTRG